MHWRSASELGQKYATQNYPSQGTPICKLHGPSIKPHTLPQQHFLNVLPADITVLLNALLHVKHLVLTDLYWCVLPSFPRQIKLTCVKDYQMLLWIPQVESIEWLYLSLGHRESFCCPTGALNCGIVYHSPWPKPNCLHFVQLCFTTDSWQILFIFPDHQITRSPDLRVLQFLAGFKNDWWPIVMVCHGAWAQMFNAHAWVVRSIPIHLHNGSWPISGLHLGSLVFIQLEASKLGQNDDVITGGANQSPGLWQQSQKSPGYLT